MSFFLFLFFTYNNFAFTSIIMSAANIVPDVLNRCGDWHKLYVHQTCKVRFPWHPHADLYCALKSYGAIGVQGRHRVGYGGIESGAGLEVG